MVQRTILRSTGWLLAVSVMSIACKSNDPSYAPRTSIPGVDRPQETPERQGSAAAASDELGLTTESLLDAFIGRVALAARDEGGMIAVFPAFARHANQPTVSELGIHLMERTANGLRDHGVPSVVAGTELRAELARANRPVEFLCGADDVKEFASWIGARFVVYGEAQIESNNAIEGDSAVAIDWRCARLGGGEVTQQKLLLRSGRLATDLAAMAQRGSDWSICRANDVQLSLDQEIEIQSARFVRALFAQHQGALSTTGEPVRVKVLPTLLPATAASAATLYEFSAALEQSIDRQLADPSVQQSVNPLQAAMQRPGTILGRKYATHDEAMAEYQRLRRNLEATSAGQLGQLIAEKLELGVRRNGLVKVELVPESGDLGSVLQVIMDESRAARDQGAIDADSIGSIEADGSQLLLQSRMRKNLDGRYELVASLTRMTGGFWSSGDQPVPLGPHFARELQRLIDG